MRSSTKSENCSDNMNNNTIDADDDRDRGSTDDIIDITDNDSSKVHNPSGNGESELTLRTDPGENDKKVNVYEQVG